MIKACTFVLASSFVMACGGATEPPKTAASSSDGSEHAAEATPAPPATPEPTADTKPAPPGPVLAETPDAKLGTAEPGFGLAVGQRAPDATLEDISGKNQKLSDLYEAGPTFVVFYRGGWCPFCNLQLHDLAASKAEFDKRGVRLVAISVDKPTEEAKTQAKDGIPFPMLSDSKLVAHKAFKVVHAATAEEQKKMAGFGLDLSAYSGETHKSYAVPSVFLVDKTGVIRFAHVNQDFKTRPSAKQLLGVADKLVVK
jgi:peroxiredoxin